MKKILRQRDDPYAQKGYIRCVRGVWQEHKWHICSCFGKMTKSTEEKGAFGKHFHKIYKN